MKTYTIHKPVRQDALQRAGVQNETEFARWFANSISQECGGCEIQGVYEDGFLRLQVEEQNMPDVDRALDARNLFYGA
jgi:hypothetical protein